MNTRNPQPDTTGATITPDTSVAAYGRTDTYFIRFVRENHIRFCTVAEFAGAMNYSYSGFCKRFYKLFGMPAYRWMKEQKAKRVYQEIIRDHKPLKEIGYEYGFSGVSQFWRFCSENFGATPANIRKKRT